MASGVITLDQLRKTALPPSDSSSSDATSSASTDSAVSPQSTLKTLSLDDLRKDLPSEGPSGDSILMSLGKGLGTGAAKTAETVNLAIGGLATIVDAVDSLARGKQVTQAQDAVFRNLVDPNVAQLEDLKLAPGTKLPGRVANTVGQTIDFIANAVLTGPAEGASVVAAKGAAGVLEPTVVETGLQLAAKHARQGAGMAQVPAVKEAIDAGREILDKTGDKEAALRVAQRKYLVTVATAMGPMAAPGGIASRIATGAGVSVAMGEASRQSMNAVLPGDMQQPFTVEGVVESALLGSVFGALAGKDPYAPAANLRKLGPDKFEQFAAQDPVKAQQVANAVKRTDTKLGEAAQKTVDKVKGLGLEELRKKGEEAAKKNPKKEPVLPKEWEFNDETKSANEPSAEVKLTAENIDIPPVAEHRDALSREQVLAREDNAWDAKINLRNKIKRKLPGNLQIPINHESPVEFDLAHEGTMPFLAQAAQQIRNSKSEDFWDSHTARTTVDHPVSAQPYTAKQLLESMAKGAAGSHLPVVLNKIAPFLENVKVQFVHPDHPLLQEKKAGGLYDPKTKTITIGVEESNVTNPRVTKTILHEAVHAAVYDFMTINPNHPYTKEMRNLMAETRRRANAMGKAFREIKKEEVDKGFSPIALKHIFHTLYGMTNPHEFVAEALSNPQFQRFLLLSEAYASKGWKGRARDLADTVGYTIKKMLGYKGEMESKLLDSIIGTSGDIMRSWKEAVQKHNAAKNNKTKAVSEERSINDPPADLTSKRLEKLIKSGDAYQPKDRQQVEKAFADGDRVYVAHEMDELPQEVKSISVARKYDLEQIVIEKGALTKEKEQTQQTVTTVGELTRQYEQLKADKTPGLRTRRVDLAWDEFKKGKYTLEEFREILQEVIQDAHDTVAEQQASTIQELGRAATDIAAERWGVRPTIHEAGGIPLPRREILAATRIGLKFLRKSKAFAYAEGKLKEYTRQIAHAIMPETLGKKAEQAAAIISHATARWKAMNAQIQGMSQARRKFWNENAKDALQFIKDYEAGKTMQGALEDFRQAYHGLMEWVAAEDKAHGIKYELEDNYITHLFERKEEVASFLKQKFGSKFGDPYFMKDRLGKTYEELLKMGYKPKYTNPEDIMMARVYASNIAHARVEMFEELAKSGLVKRVPFTKAGKAAESPPPGWSERMWRSPNGKKYYAHDEAAAILHNAFETKSLWNMEGVLGDTFRGAMWIKNKIVPIRLLGFFHAAHIGLLINNAAAFTRVGKMLLAGNVSPKLFFKELTSAAVPLSGVWDSGANKILQAYWGKVPEASLNQGDRQLLMYMQEGGLVPGMAEQDRGTSLGRFKDAVQQGKKTAIFRAPFAAIDALQYPMFHIWIPTLKIAAFARDTAVAMHLDPTLANDAAKRVQVLAKIRKSVDNRFGEMNYDTLFWNRMLKDAAVVNTLSLGWQLGFIREYGGGAVEIVKGVAKEESLASMAKTGQLDRAMFATAYMAGGTLLAGLMTYAFTGEKPEGLDWFYPRTGEEDADGKPKRVNTPYFTREIASIYMHMQKEGVVPGLKHLVMNKASGVFGLLSATATGVNGLDQEVRDPNGTAFEQLSQTLHFVFRDVEPISAGSFRDSSSSKEKTLNVMGFSPAPKYATETPLQAAVSGTFQKYFGAKQTPYDRAVFSQDSKRLRNALEKDLPEYDTLLDEMEKKYDLTPSEIRRLEKTVARGTDPFIKMFGRLTWQQQKQILDEHWNEMTLDEQEEYLKRSNKEHLRNNYEPPEAK